MAAADSYLVLLRHGEVASHHGDVPVTDDGLVYAEEVGRRLREQVSTPITVLFGGTRRTRETAEALTRGLGLPASDRPQDSFALRNPDLYVAGSRVEMVSSAQALADQVPGMTLHDVAGLDWWQQWFQAKDRVGWWLSDEDPPGETAVDLCQRILRFTESLMDPGPLHGHTVVGVTHSPLLRALSVCSTSLDPGEPAYVSGLKVAVERGALVVQPFTP